MPLPFAFPVLRRGRPKNSGEKHRGRGGRYLSGLRVANRRSSSDNSRGLCISNVYSSGRSITSHAASSTRPNSLLRLLMGVRILIEYDLVRHQSILYTAVVVVVPLLLLLLYLFLRGLLLPFPASRVETTQLWETMRGQRRAPSISYT